MLCDGCPRNVFEVTRNDSLANAILEVQRTAGVVVALATAFLLVRRWRAATAPQRRAVAPVLWAGSATVLLLAVSIANDAVDDPLGQAPKWAVYFVFASVPVAVLIVLLQQRLARGAVAGLVVELGDRASGNDLREALSRARSPTRRSRSCTGSRGRPYVDAAGRRWSCRPLAPGGWRRSWRARAAVAALVHDPALGDNAELVESDFAAAALALENERLQAELRARLGELQASRARLVEATVSERRRIERDLHDGAQHGSSRSRWPSGSPSRGSGGPVAAGADRPRRARALASRSTSCAS